jgi:phospholipase C
MKRVSGPRNTANLSQLFNHHLAAPGGFIPQPGWTLLVKTLVLIVLASAASVLASGQISNFQHIVIIYQENRTPDNLFQGLCGTGGSLCPNPYDLQKWGINDKGHKIPLAEYSLGNPYDPNHSHTAFVRMCDLDTSSNQCKMDGLSSATCGSGKCSFAYVTPSDVAPYISMAQQYGWANYMFQTNQGPSTPAHQFIFGGTSAPSASDDAAAIFVIGEQPLDGCLAPLDDIFQLISPQTVPNGHSVVNNPLGTTCFTRDTIPTLLDQHNPPLSWKYYAPFGPKGFWTAPNWIRNICQPNSNYTACSGAEFKKSVQFNPTLVLSDIGRCHLANMVWVIPAGQNSDHPGFKAGGSGGPSWVSSIVNKIGESPCTDKVNGKSLTYWQDTAIFITWDDWGGWYDHERPTLLSVPAAGQGDNQYGFRVPLVVVSAYTPVGFVSNLRSDVGSILRYIEQNFGIPEGALNFADQRATNDLTEFFNLKQTPRTFTPISAPLNEDFFLHDKRPMEPPDTD